MPLYDALIVPEYPSDAAVPVPEVARGLLSYVGPVMVRERFELLARDEARALLGIPEDALAVYVSAGGGGDPGAEAQLLALASLAAEVGLHLVIGAGPLYRGRRIFGPSMTWLSGIPAAEILPGMDLAVCSAGYNTFHEVLFAGVPAVFLPQAKIADEQDRRADRAVAAGAAIAIPPGGTVRSAIDRFRDPQFRHAASKAARGLVPRNCARDAAAELLRLVLAPVDVDLAEEVVDDAILARAGDFAAVCELSARLEGRRKNGPPIRFAGDLTSLEASADLLSIGDEHGLPPSVAIRRIGAALAGIQGGSLKIRVAKARVALAESA